MILILLFLLYGYLVIACIQSGNGGGGAPFARLFPHSCPPEDRFLAFSIVGGVALLTGCLAFWPDVSSVGGPLCACWLIFLIGHTCYGLIHRPRIVEKVEEPPIYVPVVSGSAGKFGEALAVTNNYWLGADGRESDLSLYLPANVAQEIRQAIQTANTRAEDLSGRNLGLVTDNQKFNAELTVCREKLERAERALEDATRRLDSARLIRAGGALQDMQNKTLDELTQAITETQRTLTALMSLRETRKREQGTKKADTSDLFSDNERKR